MIEQNLATVPAPLPLIDLRPRGASDGFSPVKSLLR
jgi:hypothetical protein